jgi:hypothetical protein
MPIADRRCSSPLRFLMGVLSETFRNPLWLLALGALSAGISLVADLLFGQASDPPSWGQFALLIAGIVFVILPLYALVAILWHRVILWGQDRPLRTLLQRLPIFRYWRGILLAFLIGLPVFIIAAILESWFRTVSLDILRVDRSSSLLLGLSVFVGKWAAPLLMAICIPLAGIFLPGVAVGRPVEFRSAMKAVVRMALPVSFAVIAIVVLHFGLQLAFELYLAQRSNPLVVPYPLSTHIYGERVLEVTASFLLLTVMTEAWRVSIGHEPDGSLGQRRPRV